MGILELTCDPAIPEAWMILVFLLWMICAPIILGFNIYLKKGIKPILSSILVMTLLISPSIYSIGSRHFGEWGELKELMVAYDQKRKMHEAGQSKITNYEEKLKFYKLYPQPEFKFSGSDKTIKVSYMEWISSPHKIALSWGQGANCAFHLTAMVSVYGD